MDNNTFDTLIILRPNNESTTNKFDGDILILDSEQVWKVRSSNPKLEIYSHDDDKYVHTRVNRTERDNKITIFTMNSLIGNYMFGNRIRTVGSWNDLTSHYIERQYSKRLELLNSIPNPYKLPVINMYLLCLDNRCKDNNLNADHIRYVFTEGTSIDSINFMCSESKRLGYDVFHGIFLMFALSDLGYLEASYIIRYIKEEPFFSELYFYLWEYPSEFKEEVTSHVKDKKIHYLCIRNLLRLLCTYATHYNNPYMTLDVEQFASFLRQYTLVQDEDDDEESMQLWKDGIRRRLH